MALDSTRYRALRCETCRGVSKCLLSMNQQLWWTCMILPKVFKTVCNGGDQAYGISQLMSWHSLVEVCVSSTDNRIHCFAALIAR